MRPWTADVRGPGARDRRPEPAVPSGARWGALQPIQLLAVGRLLFPLLWLVLAGLALRSALAFGVDSRLRSATWIGAALMPALVAPGGGAVDSGYAELFVTTALSGVACGMLTKDAVLVVAGTVVVALVKPEGPAYAGLHLLALAVAGLRARGLTKTALGVVAALGVVSVSALLATRRGSLPYERIPDVLLGEAANLLVVRRYGFVWILLGVLAVLPRRLVGPCPSPALGWLVLGGLSVAPAPFLLWPDVTVEHHLRSSMPRLLLHWAAPGWLLAMAWLARSGADRTERRDELDTPRDRGASTMSA